MSDIERRVVEALVNQFGTEGPTITPATRFREDLEADSLQIVELIMTVEELFNIEVADNDAEKLRTVGDVVTYVATRRGS